MNRTAFSLVELSIVLVILGLLTGGILAGQSLIRAAELRAISTEHDKFITAVQTFRDKYMALPGDMNNATKFWNPAANCPGNASQGTTDGTTCDGDGNGLIEPTYSNANESFRFWQHLANAALIEGRYNGVVGSNGNNYDALIGTNVPVARFGGGAGWSTRNFNNSALGVATFFARDYGNLLTVGTDCGSACETHGPVLKPEEMWNIDTKSDDGMPAQGSVQTMRWSGCTEAADGTQVNTAYDLDNAAKVCQPVYLKAF